MTAPQPPGPSDPTRATGQAAVPEQREAPPGGRPATGPAVAGPPAGGAPVFGVPGGAPPGGSFGPGDRPAPPPAPRRKRSWAVAVALLAMLISAGAALLSWRALDQANDAREIALGRGGATPGPAPEPTAAPPPSPSGDPALPSASSSQLVITKESVFDPKYGATEMQVLTSCTTRYLDLDTPQVDVTAETFDLAQRGPCGGGGGITYQGGDGVRIAEVSNAGTTPKECYDRINLGAAPPGERIAVRQGLILCVWTSVDAAKDRGDRSQMVVLKVDSVAGNDTVTTTLKAWRIPL